MEKSSNWLTRQVVLFPGPSPQNFHRSHRRLGRFGFDASLRRMRRLLRAQEVELNGEADDELGRRGAWAWWICFRFCQRFRVWGIGLPLIV